MSLGTMPPPASVRGRDARDRILRAALANFGRDGFALATTRRIARDAHVSLPAIKYYFENKEGLYLACAREIVERYRSEIGEFVLSVVDDLDRGLTADGARQHLKELMRRVIALTDAGDAGDDGDADLRTAFVLREMTDQGPAFELLYRRLWQPGVRLTATLIARIEGKAEPDRKAHIRALMLHASLTTFSATRPVSVRYLGVGPTPHPWREGTDAALTVIDEQIDQLGAAGNLTNGRRCSPPAIT